MNEQTKAKPKRRFAREPKAATRANAQADAKKPAKPKTSKIVGVIALLQRCGERLVL